MLKTDNPDDFLTSKIFVVFFKIYFCLLFKNLFFNFKVIIALEDEFDFEIPDGDSDRMKTPRDIYKYICEKYDIY